MNASKADRERTSEAEITFTEITPERTHVVLTHRHLDSHGDGWQGMRGAVSGGWTLTPFAEGIERANHVAGRRLPIVSDATMRGRLASTSTYTAILLCATDAFVRPAVDPIAWEHGRRNMALADAGILSIVLPVMDDSDLAGIGVFAATPDETRAIIDDDLA